MSSRTRWALAIGIALAAVMLVASLPVPTAPASPTASVPVSPTILPTPYAMATDLSRVPAGAEHAAAAEYLSGLSQPQKTELGYLYEHPNSGYGAEILGNSGLQLACGFFGIGCNLNWGSVGLAALGGCAVGAALGSPAAGIGAAPGCAVGAAFGIATDIFGQDTANIPAQTGREEPDQAELLQGVLNAYNESDGLAASLYSGLNATQYFLDTVADSAAMQQLNDSTFSADLDLSDTPVGYFLNSVLNPVEYVNGKTLQYDQSWMQSAYGSGGVYASSGSWGLDGISDTSVCVGFYSNTGDDKCPTSIVPTIAGGNEIYNTGAAFPLYIENGANFSYEAISGSCTISSIDGLDSAFTTATSGTSKDVYNFTGPSDYFLASSPCTFNGFGIMALPAITGTTTTAMQVYACDNAGLCDPFDQSSGNTVLTAGTLLCMTDDSTSCSATAPQGRTDPFNAWTFEPKQVMTMMAAAETTAHVYWSFLKGLGYNGAPGAGTSNPVPENCAIPMPSFALPPEVADDIVGISSNFTEMYGVYSAWLNSISTFFDVAPNTTSFCSGHAVFTVGGGSWGDLNVNITGFIYIPGKAWSKTGTLVSSSIPKLGRLSTWTFNGSTPSSVCAKPDQTGLSVCTEGGLSATNTTPIQYTGWPLLGTWNLTVGAVNEVPRNDPITIIPTEYLTDLTLGGNGTNVSIGSSSPPPGTACYYNTTSNLCDEGRTSDGLTPAAVQPFAAAAGDALYVSTCVVNGIPVDSVCPLTFSTITDYYGNESCSTGSNGACNNPAPTFSSAPGLCSIVVISTLCSLFDDVFGGLGGGILSTLIVVAVVLGVLYVAYRVVSGRRERSGGSGGVTVVEGPRT
jgi:hypothetical protein